VIFLTVGSMFPFDRLVRSMDGLIADGTITETVEAQIGDGLYEPQHMRFSRFMGKPEYVEKFMQADKIVAHAGAGTIALALQYGKPLLVMPRRGRLAEHVNDHQLVTAKKYAALQHVLLAEDERALGRQLVSLGAFKPLPRAVKSRELAGRIGEFLKSHM
jgi:beta-1,4-N-acetylglucosaminyltransferase